MRNLHKALVSSNLNYLIKVSTPISMDIIPKPFPPSAATFNASWNSTISGILDFLKNYVLNKEVERVFISLVQKTRSN
ncbi:putative glucan endo-1,3-beta-D-glucosidase [Helianthus debilis subsp. tardiflorus]